MNCPKCGCDELVQEELDFRSMTARIQCMDCLTMIDLELAVKAAEPERSPAGSTPAENGPDHLRATRILIEGASRQICDHAKALEHLQAALDRLSQIETLN